MVAICIKYCYVLLINLYYIPDPPFLLHAILETALTHLRVSLNMGWRIRFSNILPTHVTTHNTVWLP